MAVRTDWHEDASAVGPPGVDPFEVQSSRAMSGAAPPLILGTSGDELMDRLRVLIRRESALFNQDVTCPIRDRPDTCCSACPLNESEQPTPKARLCRVGVEQDKVLTLLAAQDMQRGG